MSDDKIALVGYYEFVAQHFQKVSKSSKTSKKVQKHHSSAKARTTIRNTVCLRFVDDKRLSKQSSNERNLNIIIFKKDCGLLQWNCPFQIELNKKTC